MNASLVMCTVITDCQFLCTRCPKRGWFTDSTTNQGWIAARAALWPSKANKANSEKDVCVLSGKKYLQDSGRSYYLLL